MIRSIDWFARHGVAPNLLAALILIGGLFAVVGLDWIPLPGGKRLPVPPAITQEVFPEFSLDVITVQVPYLGAAPEEVEQGVILRVEEAIDGIDEVEKITSTAAEGMALVSIQLELGSDLREVLDDVKARIDAIDTFPAETEQPVVAELTNRRGVVDLVIYGDVDYPTLRSLAERARDDLSALDEITLVQLAAAPDREIAIEVSEHDLRRHGLTFDEIAERVRRSSLDLPGGSVRTDSGEILLRTEGQAYTGRDFEKIVLRTRPDGSEILLGDVARVIDGFEDNDLSLSFDGKPGVLLNVFRVGDEDALSVAAAAKEYAEALQSELPPGVGVASWNDASLVLRDRRNLLLRNAATGLLLVLLLLTAFLRLRLAIWVVVGLLIAFMGTLWLMPVMDVTINVISLFAFILVLGIVVDDAIVVGESIYTHQKRSGQGLEGAIAGARRVAQPVTFAVLTTVAAFTPLLAVEGTIGKVMRVMALIVIPCLLWSLVESLWILPAHLKHYRPRDRGNRWVRLQTAIADGLEAFIERFYRPVVRRALEYRYVTIAVALTTLLITGGLVGGGFLRFVFFPAVESDYISAAIVMPPGTPAEATERAVDRLERAANEVREAVRQESGEDPFRAMAGSVGEQPFAAIQQQNAGSQPAGRTLSSNLGELTIELMPAQDRTVLAEDLTDRWREATGTIPDALELAFTATLFSAGADIEVQLVGSDIDALVEASARLKSEIAGYAGTFGITDTFRAGKREWKLDIEPQAEALGLTLADLARQTRQAFYGEEAQRIQRGRDDIRVMVRYPEEERRTLASVETMRVRRPDGSEVPFSEVARVESGRGYSTITRVDRRRVVSVRADVDESVTTAGNVIGALRESALPQLVADFPGVSYSFEGAQEEQRKTMTGLARGFVFAMILIYALLAIPLRSYAQPLLIMSAIPFGLVGAAWGHLVMGVDLTILSMFGVVALTGVVVNDSLVMVDFINNHRKESGDELEAVASAGVARFRPILLTSLTTFAGLSPLMWEKSMQARFLIPMAISLAYGVIFATLITLLLVPAGYLVLQDLKRLFRNEKSPAADATGLESNEAARVRS